MSALRHFCKKTPEQAIWSLLRRGDPAGTRTPDLRLKRALLYQLSYWVITGWDGWTRTSECGSQSPVPYHLATPQYCKVRQGPERTLRPSATVWGG